MPGPDIIAEISLPDIGATERLAAQIAPLLGPGDVVALDGALGTGKTLLCRAIIQALGYSGDVPSPTFNLLQIYDLPAFNCPVWHMDLYRLEKPEEAFELGIEDGLETAACLIEWPSKLGIYLPPGFLTLRLEHGTDAGTRRLTIICDGLWANRLRGIV